LKFPLIENAKNLKKQLGSGIGNMVSLKYTAFPMPDP